jgi:hypothetical protein
MSMNVRQPLTNDPLDADAFSAPVEGPKQASGACPHLGCRVPRNFVTFKGSDGRLWCITHCPNQGPKQTATTRGGASKRRKETRVVSPGTADPDFSSTKAIRAWCETRAGMVERGELDQRVVPDKLAALAKATHDTDALDKLGELEQLIRARLGSA